MASPLRAVVAVAAELVVAAVLLAVARLVVEAAAHRLVLAHKLLPLVRLQVAVVVAVRPVMLPEAAALLVLVQGLVASESLRSR